MFSGARRTKPDIVSQARPRAQSDRYKLLTNKGNEHKDKTISTEEKKRKEIDSMKLWCSVGVES